ncbi:acetyltransferase [Sphingomonas sp. Leaf407]|uniref:gamma carbonic anhydrase family protein n=1 Tax=unclassified Sphingomonas TaxID=196159 RepID=UPI0006F889DA|nr:MULTISPECIES: gamma carbonic anhydrase family protein [unclassified Sphingomonas]KQN37401.1 acetyltransferase [Sphingomonas sp. Leaf42]KQT27770.1 acetyltransferase [Sphingomonas sp. Leaf407]
MPCYALADAAPDLAADAWVAPSADLIGAVRLGAQASVWFGATIRADNGPIVVGARSNIQDGAVLHGDPGAPLTVGEDCTIGHRAILHGCTIGDRVLIGMGATILNHAVIADDCVVGAGALVTEGKSFPPGSLIVGSPARAVRTLTDEQLAGLRLSAAVYVAKAKHYRDVLKTNC